MNRTIRNLPRIIVMGTLLSTLLALSGPTAFAHQQPAHHQQASAFLTHTPHGQATLKWNPDNEELTVMILLTGLQANSTHPAHIHAGNCNSDGKIIYLLADVVADAGGNAFSRTTINDVDNGIPFSGWYINVHSGPTLASTDQALPIACGNISNPHEASALTISLGSTNAANQAAAGEAHLSLQNNTLIVKVIEWNLAPGSSHALHIHAGSCQNQVPGTIVHSLTTLTADATGDGTSVTTIQGVKSIPASGWYINVHFATDLSSQSGFDPIDCGDVVR